jgi:hypothetical protein
VSFGAIEFPDFLVVEVSRFVFGAFVDVPFKDLGTTR